MFKSLYLSLGGLMILGYSAWSLSGMELGGTRRDKVPRTAYRKAGSSSRRSRAYYYGRSRSRRYGSGYSFGK